MRSRLAGCLILAACSGGTEPGSELPLLVVPTVDTLAADSSVQLRAVKVARGGDTVDVLGVLWSSRDPDIAEVSASGLVTGIRSGEVTIVALIGDLRGTSEVRVERRFQAKDVATGSAGLCAVDLAGRIWCEGGWGSGAAHPAVDTTEIRTFFTPVSGPERYTDVGSNRFFGCGLDTNRRLLCWGYRPLGESLSAGVPTPIASELRFDTLSVHGWLGCGLAAQTAYCWGVPIAAIKPIDTGGAPLVKLDVLGFDACGWTSQSVELCWDQYGFPTPVGRGITQPSAPGVPPLHGLVRGEEFFCGLDSTGLAWCWGANDQGQLGNGTILSSSHPVPVTGERSFILLSAAVGGYRACGISDQNELVCWGLGFGSVPTAVLY